MRLGLTEEQHAQLLGVDITKTNWQTMAENFARREYIFEGDRTIYKAAREASKQFEHGFADLGDVRQTAGTVTRDLVDLVRSAAPVGDLGVDERHFHFLVAEPGS